MNKLLSILRSKKGSLAINMSVTILVIMALLSLILSLFPVFNRSSVQNSMAHELARYTERRGCIDNKLYQELERLKSASGIDCTMTFEGDFMGSSKKIQMGNPFTITLKSQANIGIGGIVKIPVTLKSSGTGRSEKYWK